MMHPTYNPLPLNTRAQVVDILNQLLCDFIALTYAAKQAHWNVQGSDFIATHRLFDEVYELGGNIADGLAEGLVALGGHAYGTVEVAATNSRIPAFPLDLTDSTQMITEVVSRLGRASALLIDAIQQVGKLDPTTQNDLMGYHTQVNKYIYFLEKHLKAQ